MSAGGAFGGNRGLRPVPPEKGVFPLDHQHECDLDKKEYLSCLKSSGHLSERCRQFSKKYLQCRMDRNLMARQNMSELGFGKEIEPPSQLCNQLMTQGVFSYVSRNSLEITKTDHREQRGTLIRAGRP